MRIPIRPPNATVVLSAIILVLLCPRVQAAQPGMRTMELRVAADQEFRKYPDWQNTLRRRIGDASKFYEAHFGIRFEIKDIGGWESIAPDSYLEKFRADFRNKIPLDAVDAVVGFSGKASADLHMAEGDYFGRYVLVMDWTDKDGHRTLSEGRVVSTMEHEIMHLFGMWHSSDPASVMAFASTDFSNRVDARILQYMALMRDYDLKQGVWGLDQATLKKIVEIHGLDYKDDVKDDFPLVQAYLFEADKLRKTKKLDEAEAMCRRAIGLFPASYKAHTELGMVLYAKYKAAESESFSREALAEFREAIKINPKDGFSYVNVGMILCFVEKKYPEAWDAVQQAQKLGAYVVPSFLAFLKTKI